jgi:outer membrane protein assembly factor BamB
MNFIKHKSLEARKRFTWTFILGIVCTLSAFPQSVTEWRGAGRTGVYNEPGLLSVWPAGGPALLWTVKDLPTGYSSVTIANNTLYLTGKKDTMDIVTALDMKGNLKWQTIYGQSWNASFPESRCTPTIDNNRLFLTSGLGDVACLDASNGKIIWSLNASEKYEGSFGMWGIAESPLIIGNKLIYTPGGKKTTMIALDKTNGNLIWKSETLKDNPSYTSPILIQYQGKQQIINVSESFIFAVSPDDGKMIWKFNYIKFENSDDGDINTNTPLYYNGSIFVSNGYDHCGVLLKLSADGNSVSVGWFNKTLDTHHGGFVRVGEYIYGSNWVNNSLGDWICLDWNTGKTMYDKLWINKGPIISDGQMLYCQEEKTGNIALVKADPEKFVVTSTFKIPFGSGPYWAHPVICNGVLYIRHGNALMAYDIKKK